MGARGESSFLLCSSGLVLTGLSWYGLGRLILHRRESSYRAFGMLLAAVNAVWSLWLTLKDDLEGVHHQEFLGLAAGLFGVGLLITLHSFALRPAWRAVGIDRRETRGTAATGEPPETGR
jgi:hypothetical protein